MYDLAVIGAGPAGYNAALHASDLGQKTALIEANEIGGVCLNKGCIPTKSLLKSAQVYSLAQGGEIFEVCFDNVSIDCEKMYQRKDKVIEKLKKGIEYLIKKSTLDLILGQAEFVDEHTLKVNDTIIKAENILIACGSRPSKLRIKGEEYAIDSDDVLAQPIDEKEILIIGGGVIGIEFASLFSMLGKNVTILEYENGILPQSDLDAVNALTMSLKKRGVKIFTNSKVCEIIKDEKYKVLATVKGEDKEFIAEKVITCTGRTPNITALKLDNAKVKHAQSIIVDDNCKTNIPNIYSVGDVSAKIKLAHFAEAQAICTVDYIASKTPSIDLRTVPSVVYSSPEIASVGTLWQAESKLHFCKVFMNSNGKASIEDSTSGFVKIVFNEDKVIVGAVIVNSRASELIGEMCLAITNKLTLDDIIKTIHPHPTLSEAVRLCAIEGKKLVMEA